MPYLITLMIDEIDEKINVTPGFKSPIILIIAACLLDSKTVDIVTSFFVYNEY